MKSAEVAIVNKEGWLHSLLNVFFKTDVFVSFFGLDYKCMHNVEQLSIRAEKIQLKLAWVLSTRPTTRSATKT